MDGLASAFIANEFFNYIETQCSSIPIQYGENIEDILIHNYKLHKNCNLVFVDFSAKRDILLNLANKVNSILIIDHHKTAQADLKDIEQDAKNITCYFDMEHSGAVLTYMFFRENLQSENFLRIPLESRKLFDYIEDRDLWNWNLHKSEEISEYLKFKVKENDVEAFGELIQNFNFKEAELIGEILITQKKEAVSRKIKKVKDIKLCGINLCAINATENISEIGNEICKTYNKPALIYFMDNTNSVILSFRSLDSLSDVSKIATFFGGGGHRNACGASDISLSMLQSILDNEFANFNCNINKKQLKLNFE
jgi:oligoribonuclease NrnB/cAMP/cGMP phosphodiesterase (DHH superfamily)